MSCLPHSPPSGSAIELHVSRGIPYSSTQKLRKLTPANFLLPRLPVIRQKSEAFCGKFLRVGRLPSCHLAGARLIPPCCRGHAVARNSDYYYYSRIFIFVCESEYAKVFTNECKRKKCNETNIGDFQVLFKKLLNFLAMIIWLEIRRY